MYRTATAAALALTLATPAVAYEALANSVGVDPSLYSKSEVIALKSALDSDDMAKANHIRRQVEAGQPVFSTGDGDLPAFAIEQALEDDDQIRARFLTQKANGEIPDLVPGSPGHIALAEALGLDWRDYSRAELTAIVAD